MTMASAGGESGGKGTTSKPETRGEITPKDPSPIPSGSAPRTTAVTPASAGLGDLTRADAAYDELSEIGNGAYGTVYRGRDRYKKDHYVALKKLRIPLDDGGVPYNALREIAVLKQLGKFNHPNIVRLLDICHGPEDSQNRLNLVFVFEYIEQDLDSYLKRCPSPGLSLDLIKRLMHQILTGVEFLHTQRVIHRDLKPQNILVSRNSQIKIADFGLARTYDFKMKLTTKVVTLYYRAPEVLLSNSYATPIDLWSCGCIFAELYRRKPLFQGVTEGDQLQQIFDVIGRPSEEEWPKDVSIPLGNFREHEGRPIQDLVPEITADAIDMLRKLIKFNPTLRWSAQQALRHHYFRGLVQNRTQPAATRDVPMVQILSPLYPSNFSPTSPNTQAQQHYVQAGTNPAAARISPAQTAPANTASSQTNDENNPNAGNNPVPAPNTIAQESLVTKVSDRDTSSSAIDTSENVSVNDSIMSVSSNDTTIEENS